MIIYHLIFKKQISVSFVKDQCVIPAAKFSQDVVKECGIMGVVVMTTADENLTRLRQTC